MKDWADERNELAAWLFMRARTRDEMNFWARLHDDLTDMFDWPDMDLDRWYDIATNKGHE